MTKIIIMSYSLLLTGVLIGGCSGQSTAPAPVPEAQFGDAVRNVMQSQIHDFGAALQPSTEALEGSDSDRLNAVLGAYRQDVATPETTSQQPINLSLGSGQR